MPNVKKKIYDEILSLLEAQMGKANYKLESNKRAIKRLAEEQKDIKRIRSECGRIISEFIRRKKSLE